jgi:thiamine-monophosphate kinase
MSAGEFAYIDWVRQRTNAFPGVGVIVGPGDDTAVLVPPSRVQLATTDMLLEGSCFLLAEAGAFRVGRKAINVNLSDIAAMAGVPKSILVSVGLPRRQGREIAEELYLGMRDAADTFGVPIVGGDTNSWECPLVISVAVMGEATDRGPVLRSGARVGDWIYTTGPLGGSILGKHLDFRPRIDEALAIHASIDLHACIDISDGLAKDLFHICTESKVGAVVYAERIPIADAARELAKRDGVSPLEHALRDGEDFELIFTTSSANASKIHSDFPYCRHIGEIVDRGYWLENNSVREPLEPKGYEHGLS